MNVNYALYCVMDSSICHPDALVNMASGLVDQGISCMQLRMKNAASEMIAESSKKLLEILKPKKIPLIINDHIELAKNMNADGVHIGQKDIPYLEARKYLGYEKIIGLSIENKEQAQKCRHLDVDYFSVGPVYHTDTKPDAAPPIGVQQLKEIRDVFPKPVIAIGGINEKNVLAVLKTGVTGIAVVSAILTSSNPKGVTRNLARLIAHHQQSHVRN